MLLVLLLLLLLLLLLPLLLLLLLLLLVEKVSLGVARCAAGEMALTAMAGV